MTRFAGTHDAPSQILRQAASVAIANALAGVTACALAAFAPVLAVAAAVDEAPGASLRFNNLTTEDGLAQNWVSSIEQDQTGFIWIGTHGGLQRFDGRDMQTFLHDPQDDRTVSDNSISALHEDNSGNLWVGTSTAGVNRFVAAERRFERYRHQAGDEASLVHNRIWALESDSTGRVWIATDGGLDSLDPATGEITHHRVNGAPDGSSVVRSLLTDREGLVWVGTFDGLYVVSPESLTLSRFAPRGQAHSEGQNEGQNEGDGMLGNAGVNALFEDRVGRLWIGTSEGVFVASQDRSTVTAVIGAEELRRDRSGTPVATAMVEDDRGGLWVATDGAGLYRLRAGREGQWQRNHYVHNPGNPLGLTDNYLGTAFRDSGGVLWFGTSIAGISRLNPATEAFAHYRRSSSDEGQLPGNVVWSMLEAANGDVWVATENGLALLDVATGRFAPVTVGESDAANRSELVYYVTRSANGTLWVGSEAGLFSRDETGQAFEFHDVFADYADIDYAPIVHYIREDSAGVLWLGTFNGLIRYEPASRSATLIRRADGELVDDWVMAAVEGRDGTIWAGTEAGLQKIDRATGRSLAVYKNVPGDLNSLSHDSVQSLYVSNNGGLWVATVAGLSHLDVQSGSFVRYGRDTGLPSDYIYAVTGDDSGLLWVSTNKGLARLDPATGSVVAFDVEDGLQASEFNTGSVHRGDSGRLYFGGVNGFNAFLPDRVIARPQPPRVAVTSASFVGAGDVHGGASGTLEYLEVPADLGVFELRFAAFDYAAPRRNRFAYRLEGVDQDWQDAGPASSVTYRNLPPGSYTFQVRAARGDGVWSTEPAQVTLTVLAPWWRSRAAIIVYLLALLCVAVVGVRLWAARLERERLLREEREKRSVAERMHSITRGLSATLNTGSVSEQLLSSAVDLVPHTLSALFLREDGDLKLVDTRGVAEPQKSSLRSMPTSAGTVLLDIVQAAEPVALPAAAL
ncbi:MAG: two-component regulator propeller domain-containing protein, partial [Pseudomonadota bacterium]